MPSEEIAKLRVLSQKMDATDAALYNHQTELSAFFMNSPFPMWIKDLQGIMLFINNSYAKHYGMTPDEYAGVSDSVFWGDKVAKEFYANDQKVVASGEAQMMSEHITTKNYPNGITVEVHKWPIRNSEGVIVAVAGMVTGETKHEPVG